MMGWQPSFVIVRILLVFSLSCMLAGLSIFGSLLIPADSSVRILAFPAFLSRNLNVLLFWLLGVLTIAFMMWQWITINRLLAVTKVNRREISADQTKRLLAALDHVPSGQEYKVWFAVIDGCAECRTYNEQLSGPWRDWGRHHGWIVGGYTNHQLYVLKGIALGWNTNQCPEAELTLIKNALKTAGIPSKTEPVSNAFGASVGVPLGYCTMLVGLHPLAE